MPYIGSTPSSVVSRQSANIFTYTATAGQTAFTGADANGNTLSCAPSDIMVHMNGIRLEESDFTASTTTVTLVSGAAVGDEITITAFLTFESADHYTKSAADTRYVNATGDTMSGDLTIDTNTFHVDAADNRVGVGTSNPSKKLHISESVAAGEGILLTNSHNVAGTYSDLKWAYSANDQSYGSGLRFKQVDTTHGGQLEFYTDNASGTYTKQMQITENGHVTKPNQPAFSTRGTGYTQVNAAFTTVKPATTDLNVGNHYNSSTGVWTVPVAGNYLVTANGLVYPSGTGGSGSVHNCAWYKNNQQWEDIQNGEYYSNHTNITNTAIIPCAANDTLDFRFYRNSGSPASAAYSGQFNMYGYLLS